jgi:hypothetical protein
VTASAGEAMKAAAPAATRATARIALGVRMALSSVWAVS